MADAYTQERLAWLEAVARTGASDGLASRLAIILVTGFCNHERYKKDGRLIAWPSQERLAAETGSTRDGTKKALERLAKAGLLRVSPGRGRGVNTLYTLITPDPKTQTGVGVIHPEKADRRQGCASQQRGTGVEKKGDGRPEERGTGVCTNPVKEPIEEPSESILPIAAEFAAWWEVYPRKVQRKTALEAYVKAREKGATAADLLAGAIAYAAARAGENPKFTCHGASWLNGERWTDEHVSAPAERQWPTNGRPSFVEMAIHDPMEDF